MSFSIENRLHLCLIKGRWAYFKLDTIEDAWGDDWSDSPYEHNAGEPYEYHAIVMFDDEHENIRLPCDHFRNSPFSVKDINKKNVPWLQIKDGFTQVWTHLYAGKTLRSFCDTLDFHEIMNCRRIL